MMLVHANFLMSVTRVRGVITTIQMTNNIKLSSVRPPEQLFGSGFGDVAHCNTPPTPANCEAKKYM